MIQAVIFDFDGVILNSEPLHYKACCAVIEKLGLTISYDEYTDKLLGLSDKDMFPKLFSDREYPIELPQITALIAEKSAHLKEIIKRCDPLPMIDAVDQYLRFISKTITKIAICSGSLRSEIMAALTKLQQGALLPYFSTIVTSEDVQRGKPSPEGYLLTAQRLDIAPAQCLVIEDTPHGVDAAKAAGMYVVGILTSYTPKQLQHADKIISNFSELMMTTSDN